MTIGTPRLSANQNSPIQRDRSWQACTPHECRPSAPPAPKARSLSECPFSGTCRRRNTCRAYRQRERSRGVLHRTEDRRPPCGQGEGNLRGYTVDREASLRKDSSALQIRSANTRRSRERDGNNHPHRSSCRADTAPHGSSALSRMYLKQLTGTLIERKDGRTGACMFRMKTRTPTGDNSNIKENESGTAIQNLQSFLCTSFTSAQCTKIRFPRASF